MRNIFLFSILVIALLFLGCASKTESKPTTQPSSQQTAQGQTGIPTGPRMCVMEQPSMNTVRTYYDDGAERMRIENRAGGKTLITIIKEGYGLEEVSDYSPLKGKYSDCDWVAIKTDIDTIRGGMLSVAEIYKNEPGFRLTCTPWVVDSRMFETPGKVCLSR